VKLCARRHTFTCQVCTVGLHLVANIAAIRNTLAYKTFILRIIYYNRIWVRRGGWGGCIGSWCGNRREGDHWGDLGVDRWVILGDGVCRGLGGKPEGKNHWGDLGVDGWIILRWISRRWDVGIWTGLGWPRIGTGGGRL
jgi:hypothetical protein